MNGETDLMKKVTCERCDETFANSSILSKHILTNHENVNILHALAEEQSHLNSNLDSFNKDISNLFNVVMGDHIEFKKQLMNMSLGRNEQIRALDDTVKHLAKLVMKMYDHQTGEVLETKTKSTETIKPSTNNSATIVGENIPKENSPRNTNKKPWILYVGDSIGHNAEFQKLERATGSLIKTAKAYSSVPDVFEAVDDKRMVPTKFRNQRLPDVVKFEVTKRAYETLYLTFINLSPDSAPTWNKPILALNCFHSVL